jgi:hypothetical protein
MVVGMFAPRRLNLIVIQSEEKEMPAEKRRGMAFLTVHSRAEPYRTEHSSSRFGSARIFSNRTLSSASIETPDSVRLALENFERGGDSARKCTVRFGSARGCTVR